ncbi:MAG: alkaline phosphatase family protein [Thermoanaerobaculia bacterium]
MGSLRRIRRPAALLVLVLVLLPAGAGRASAPSRVRPRLVLFLVIDQGRADYLDRFRPVLTGGLGRLLDEGVRFTEAYHDHGIPTTAPGHATLVSGRFPSHHGIIGNEWIDAEDGEEVEAAEDAADGVSPRRLRATTLGDWMKEADGRSLVFAASSKDRAAAMLGGRRADGAFWFDEDGGRWVTSTYYPERAAAFLAEEPERWRVDRYFGRLWEPVDEPSEQALPGVAPIDLGVLTQPFPHAFGDPTAAPDEEFYEDFGDSPFVDEVVEEMAEALVARFGLGADEAPDLLALSFSGVDVVGHLYGPDSPEVVDTLVRVDRLIGRLLAFLDEEVGLDRVVVSLSADHGVLPVPEVARARGDEAGRMAGSALACPQLLGRHLSELHGEDRWLRDGPFFVDGALARHGLARETVEAEADEYLTACPGVRHAWTRSELLAPGAAGSGSEARLFVHAFDPERSPDLLLELEPGWVAWTDDVTTHYSSDAEDRHVPWLVRLPTGVAATVEGAVVTADIAPTLAELLGIPIPPDLDGTSRLAWMVPPAPVGAASD